MKIKLFLPLVATTMLFSTSLAASASVVSEIASARANTWLQSYFVWVSAHYVIGIASVIFGILAASHKSASTETKSRYALAAAVTAAVLTFLNPATNAKAYHQAWQGLDSVVLRFSQEIPQATESDINTAINNGEKLISDSGI